MGVRVGFLRYALGLLALLVVGGATASAETLADEAVTLSVEATTAGAEPGTAAVFTVRLSEPVDSAISARLSTEPDDGADPATAGADYVPADDVLVQLPKGETARKVEVKVVDDSLDEARETFLAVLSASVAQGIRIDPTKRTATGAIQDNDDPPSAKVANAPDVTEGNSGSAAANFTVTLSKKSGREARVAFATRDGTAKAGEDYVARTGVLRIPAGDLTGTVRVDVTGDSKVETAESFALVISRHDETAVMGSPIEGTAKILNDDTGAPPPTPASLSVADVTADEPVGQSGTATFRVTLAPAVPRAVTVKWATADGTATAGKDYTAGSGTLSFAANETSKTVAVTLLGDELAESNETFAVNLSAPTGATLADAQAVGTIVEKAATPTAVPSLSITDVAARESEGASFTVELTKAASSRVSVTVSTSDGTAREGLDYLGRTATVEFAPGERTKTIAVTVLDDELAEPAETFSVGLGNPVNAIISKSRGTGTIESSDQAAPGVARPAAIPLAALPITVTPPKKTGTTGKTATVSTARLPRMALWPLTVKVGPKGIARMTAACKRQSRVTCSGRVALETVAKPKFRLAVKSFRISRGKQASVPLKLDPRGRRLLAREGRIRARVVVLVRVGAVYLRVLPGVITLESAVAGSSKIKP